MAMKELEVTVSVAASQGRWQNMVYLKLVFFSQGETTKGAPSLLPLEEVGDLGGVWG